jgi:putative endopeptidase
MRRCDQLRRDRRGDWPRDQSRLRRSGRKSDGDGNLRDWWTAEDAQKFEERATKLGAQYESYNPLPGMKINGRQTMGENIGDLSGIAVR